jgi:hypothetical protein
MNREESDILCCPQDVDTNKFAQFNFALFRSFWYIFPHRHGCYAFSEQIFYSQHKIIISLQQPSIGPNWIHFKLVSPVFFAVVVRLECSSQNMHQITRANSFSNFLFSSKSKRQKDAISPQRSLLCACAGLSRDTFKREKNNGFENSAKFQMIFLQTISIIRKCYPSLFAHFHDTLLHIILILPRL